MTQDQMRAFEQFAAEHDLDLTRVDLGVHWQYSDCNTDYAWLAWQAALSRPQEFKAWIVCDPYAGNCSSLLESFDTREQAEEWLREMTKDDEDGYVGCQVMAREVALANYGSIHRRAPRPQSAMSDEQIEELWNRAMGMTSGLQSRAKAFAKAILSHSAGQAIPVAWMTDDGRVAMNSTKECMPSFSRVNFNIPLYVAPPAPVNAGQADGWVSVKARLPEDEKEVLVTGIGRDGRYFDLCKYYPSDGWYAFSPADDDYFETSQPTHWRELPPAPSKEKS